MARCSHEQRAGQLLSSRTHAHTAPRSTQPLTVTGCSVVPRADAFQVPQQLGARAQLVHAAIQVGIAGGPCATRGTTSATRPARSSRRCAPVGPGTPAPTRTSSAATASSCRGGRAGGFPGSVLRSPHDAINARRRSQRGPNDLSRADSALNTVGWSSQAGLDAWPAPELASRESGIDESCFCLPAPAVAAGRPLAGPQVMSRESRPPRRLGRDRAGRGLHPPRARPGCQALRGLRRARAGSAAG